MIMTIPDSANQIIHTLQEHGFEASAVGGCVRDSILGRVPQDWDITTSAKPEEVKALFAHTIDTGIEHGTVTVMLNHVGYEVTTYRIDGEYEDARHPKEVIFTGSLVEDLKRRDFTINAMAYNDKDGLVDVFGGVEDLKAGIIRCVGNPKERFSEDALRMLRAVRFAAQLGFTIEDRTAEAVCDLAPTLEKVSAERIQVELVKLVTSNHPEKLKDAYELGLTKVFLPEFDVMMQTPQHSKHHVYSVGEHSLHTMVAIPSDKVLRLTMLLHDVAKPDCATIDKEGKGHFYGHPEKGAIKAGEIFRRLKFDNDTNRKVCHLIRYHDERPQLTPQKLRHAIAKIGLASCPDLFQVKRADILGQSMYKREEKLEYVAELEAFYREILENDICVSKKTMAINGKDLIEMGMKQGKELGQVIDQLFEMVLDNPSLNTKEKLTELAHKMATPFI